MERHLWLGCDENRYGHLRCESLVGGAAAALSVGSDPDSPSLAFKGRRDRPNEDGLALVAQGNRLLLAVADGHLGIEASHTILERLWEVAAVPRNAGELGLLALGLGDPAWSGKAGTTLLLVCMDRDSGTGFGFSWGDSLAFLVGPGQVRGLTLPTQSYLYAGLVPSPERAQAFQFSLGAEDALLLCTDGVSECHYGSPLTSVTPRVIEALYAAVGPDPVELARRVGQQALAGVLGHPGGQDNLALIVAQKLLC